MFFFIKIVVARPTKQFYKNIEAQIWSEFFRKTMKNLKYEYGNFPNESLGQEKYFKHKFEVGAVG